MEGLRTPEEAKRMFVRRGESIAEWARQHGFSPQTVYDVLNRRREGFRGQGHRVAVALGLKEGAARDAAS